jgi:ubiquinone/menaquinone biosynthesis C-methylase UbiE
MDDTKARVRDRFDERAPHYDESAMHRRLATAAARFAVDHEDATPRTVLDVATGSGLVLRELRTLLPEARLTGLDISTGMLEIARASVPDAEFLLADAAVLPIPDASVEVITCVTALHLMPRPGAVIAEWERVLAPGGRVVTGTFAEMRPTHPTLRDELEQNRYTTPNPDRNHEPFRTAEAMNDTVSPAGLAVARSQVMEIEDDRVLVCELVRV